MEELMQDQSDDFCFKILLCFSHAHRVVYSATCQEAHARSAVKLLERQLPHFDRWKRFHDQGEVMCTIATLLRDLRLDEQVVTWFQRAGVIAQEHGFFSLESKTCRGLGRAAREEGRFEEGLSLLRNALAAAELNELDRPVYELYALEALIEALLAAGSLEEVEPLVLRYRDLINAQRGLAGFSFLELHATLCSARLLQALRLSTPC
jgi:hypothetical protein